MSSRSRRSTSPRQRAGGHTLFGFAWRFFGFLFAASLIFSLGRLHEHLAPLQNGIAAAAGIGARLLGTPVTVRGSVIVTGAGPNLMINHECTGVFILIIWGAFLLAHQARWRDRLRGFVVGVAILQAVNVARLATLAMIGARWPGLFAYFHEYLWQGVFVAMIAVLAVQWRDNVERQALVSR